MEVTKCKYLKLGNRGICNKPISKKHTNRELCNTHYCKGVKNFPCMKCGKGTKAKLHHICSECGGHDETNKIRKLLQQHD